MQEVLNKEKERAILIAINTGQTSDERIDEYLSELEMLAETAGAKTIFKIVQDRNRIDPAYFIGKGKAEEISELVELNKIDLIIFDDDLNPTQVRNLERLMNKKILDRAGLILDIFASHAKTKEAKTQVELAQLEYMLPRLTRAWTHLSKQYGGIGTKGPGETQIETDRRIIRTRISRLKEKLEKIESQQQTKSAQRKNLINATFVGYTNAGKSTLLNSLTDSQVLAENKLFATLDSTTRSLDLNRNTKILLSDTVGFIRKLPHNLIASFKSTLNVVRDADIILHVIDITHPFYEDHINVVDETLKELGCKDKIQIKVFNKIDALKQKNRIEYVLNKYENSIIISARRNININKMKKMIVELTEEKKKESTVKLKIEDTKTVAQIYEIADVVSATYDDDVVNLRYRASNSASDKIKGIIENINSGREKNETEN